MKGCIIHRIPLVRSSESAWRRLSQRNRKLDVREGSDWVKNGASALAAGGGRARTCPLARGPV